MKGKYTGGMISHKLDIDIDSYIYIIMIYILNYIFLDLTKEVGKWFKK